MSSLLAGGTTENQTIQRQPRSLLSLPIELVRLVCTYVDQQSALSLARTSRICLPLVEARIWSRIDLTTGSRVPLPFGWPPRSADPAAADTGSESADRHLAAIDARLAGVMAGVSDRRYGMVEELRIGVTKNRPGGIIRRTAPTLTRFEIEPATSSVYPGTRWTRYGYTDYCFLQSNLHYPNLTHLILECRTLRSLQTLTAIFTAAPNLTFLAADFWHETYEHDPRMDAPPPRFTGATRLVDLQISFRDDHSGDFAPIYDLLRHSPRIERLDLKFEEEISPLAALAGVHEVTTISQIIGGYAQLNSMRWRGLAREWAAGMAALGAFAALRQLIVRADDILDLFRYMPAGRSLESVQFLPDSHAAVFSPLDNHHIPSIYLSRLAEAQSFTPLLAARIRRSPHLRSLVLVHSPAEVKAFDSLKNLHHIHRSGQADGIINSWRYGGDELLLLRLHIGIIEIADYPETSPPPVPVETAFKRTELHYTAADGCKRVKVFDKLPQRTEQYLTHYNGMTVPLGVIANMREVEGLSEAAWYQRGVEVGRDAWKVLTDWEKIVTEAF